MKFSELVHQRHSVKSYDPGKAISDVELKELFEDVILSPAPSTFSIVGLMSSIKRNSVGFKTH